MPQISAEIGFPNNTIGVLPRVKSVVHRQVEYEHEMLIIDTFNNAGRSLPIRSGEPVLATLTSLTSKQTVVGHLHHVRDIIDGASNARHQQVVVLGPTYLMKDQKQRLFSNRTAPEVVANICRDYGFSVIAEEHNYRWPSLVQSGLSDWAMIVKTAKQIGFVVYARGATVFFHSRNYQIDSKAGSAPILTYRDSGEVAEQQDVVRFEPLAGESLPGAENSRRGLWAVDTRNVATFPSAAADPPARAARKDAPGGKFVVYESFPADTSQEAQVRMKGTSEVNRLQYKATAYSVLGRQRVGVADIVYIDNVPGDYEGHWHVQGVEHRYEGLQHSMALSLGSDSLGRLNAPRPLPIPRVPQNASGRILRPAGVALVTGRQGRVWRASRG